LDGALGSRALSPLEDDVTMNLASALGFITPRVRNGLVTIDEDAFVHRNPEKMIESLRTC
ncbi:MAG: hypothetical protein ABIH41_04900, partial [Nanoarchaeota archaeon]